MLLDQEGFECDPINKREGDTPLHSAVRWANEISEEQKEFASGLIEMMLEAGSDPRSVFSILWFTVSPAENILLRIKEQD